MTAISLWFLLEIHGVFLTTIFQSKKRMPIWAPTWWSSDFFLVGGSHSWLVRRKKTERCQQKKLTWNVKGVSNADYVQTYYAWSVWQTWIQCISHTLDKSFKKIDVSVTMKKCIQHSMQQPVRKCHWCESFFSQEALVTEDFLGLPHHFHLFLFVAGRGHFQRVLRGTCKWKHDDGTCDLTILVVMLTIELHFSLKGDRRMANDGDLQRSVVQLKEMGLQDFKGGYSTIRIILKKIYTCQSPSKSLVKILFS